MSIQTTIQTIPAQMATWLQQQWQLMKHPKQSLKKNLWWVVALLTLKGLFYCGLIAWGWMNVAFSADPILLEDLQPAQSDQYQAGIDAYREGQYLKANQTFNRLIQQKASTPEILYYLAMTEAQLGRFHLARTHYQQVISEYPQTEAAKLAEQGLSYLPQHGGRDLDLPPKPQQTVGSAANATSAPLYGPDGRKIETASQNPMQGMTPQQVQNMQQMMLMQSMMSGMGGGNNNASGMGMNPMMMMGMPGMMGNGQDEGGENSQFKMDPSMLSTMMMNQMLQNMDMSSKDDR